MDASMVLPTGYEIFSEENKQFLDARFIDQDHKNVLVRFKSGNQIRETTISSDPTGVDWIHLMEYTTEKNVFDTTADWKFQEKKKFDAAVDHLVEQKLIEKYTPIKEELETKREEVKTLVKVIERKEEEIHALLGLIDLKETEVGTLSSTVSTLATDNRILDAGIQQEIAKAQKISKELHTIKHIKPDAEPEEQEKVEFTSESLFKHLYSNNQSEEYTFKFKLACFDTEKVKKASREVKTKIRKSKSVFELIGILHEYNLC